jgi:hypothetical protein
MKCNASVLHHSIRQLNSGWGGAQKEHFAFDILAYCAITEVVLVTIHRYLPPFNS